MEDLTWFDSEKANKVWRDSYVKKSSKESEQTETRNVGPLSSVRQQNVYHLTPIKRKDKADKVSKKDIAKQKSEKIMYDRYNLEQELRNFKNEELSKQFNSARDSRAYSLYKVPKGGVVVNKPLRKIRSVNVLASPKTALVNQKNSHAKVKIDYELACGLVSAFIGVFAAKTQHSNIATICAIIAIITLVGGLRRTK